MVTGIPTLVVTLCTVLLTSKEVLNKFINIHKEDLELQKINYSIIIENTKNQITAMGLVEKIGDAKVKDTVYVEMIKSLIEK